MAVLSLIMIYFFLSQPTPLMLAAAVNPCFAYPGICGLNGYCRLGSDQRPNCLCAQGFDYIDNTNKSLGCQQNFTLQDCSAPNDDFILYTVEDIDWPMADFVWLEYIEEERCKEWCLSDCLCTVAIYRSRTCWKKKIPLQNGRFDPSLGVKVFFKMPRHNKSDDCNNKTTESCKENSSCSNPPKNLMPFVIALCAVLGASGLLHLICVTMFTLSRRPSHKKPETNESKGCSAMGMNLRSFSFKELEDATDGFRERIGKGGSGAVFKGTIASGESNITVAVKRLISPVDDGGEREFKAEMNAIGRTHHKNLVQLLGFCCEGSHRLLVYEFMEHGSLASFLFGGRKRPDWSLRLEIATGIARGLAYLHEECRDHIIHCDIKPENILLDRNWVPKIPDFGIAKLLMNGQSYTCTNIRGTRGYIAPEWFSNTAISAGITSKIDVYSFGVILLEIVCCRKNVENGPESGECSILVDLVGDCFAKGGRLERFVGEDEGARWDMRNVEKMVMVALWCVQEEPSARPTMRKVVQMLEGAVEFETPAWNYSTSVTNSSRS